jgi:ankyrin repeat protein
LPNGTEERADNKRVNPLQDMEHALLSLANPGNRHHYAGSEGMNRTLTRRTALLVLTLMPLACSSSKERARKKLAELNVTYEQETFVDRAKAGDSVVVEQFLAAGMNPNGTNKEGKTALIVACQMGRVSMVQLLLEKGAGVNVADAKFRATPLIWAGLANNSEVTKLLLEHGANPKVMEQQGGTTALEAAAGRGNVESVRLLLAKGASVNTKDKLSRTPSMVAAARGHNSILRLLAEKGADLKTVDRGRQYATHVGGEERQRRDREAAA